MKRAIVCGGAGFLGSALVKELLAHDVEVFVIVRPGFSIKRSRLSDLKISILECDIKSIFCVKEMIKSRGFDVWYQFAWDGLDRKLLADYTVQIMNVKWTMDAITVAAELGCKRFVGAGSITQLEIQANQAENLHDKYRLYKKAKQTCEYMGYSVALEYGIEFIWPIITNIYGPGEHSPRLINSMIRTLLEGKRQLLSNGKQYYDFIYITDAAKAFRLIGEYGVVGTRYTIASGTVRPLRDFLEEVAMLVSPKAELGFGELQFNGVYLHKEDYSIEHLQNDTGFFPEVTFEEGIVNTRDWIINTEM